MSGGVFLSAEWRYLAMLNYGVDPEILRPYVPAGTELDFFEERTFISLVGFRFLRTRLLGVPIPLHQNFNEVNLRFYVKRLEGARVKRGVTFIREVVPRIAIALVARYAFNENYVARPMSHRIACVPGELERISAEYGWRERGQRNRLWIKAQGPCSIPGAGTLQQFIAEHYWGYAAQRDGGCLEYEVEHEPWRLWTASESGFDGSLPAGSGHDLSRVLERPPESAFLADGSSVTVSPGRRIR